MFWMHDLIYGACLPMKVLSNHLEIVTLGWTCMHACMRKLTEGK